MRQIEGRRKIIFGLGAFAAALFIPSRKLIFPVRENPLGPLVERFDNFDCRFLANRTGNKRAFLWIVQGPDKKPQIREKFHCAPDHPFDGKVSDLPAVDIDGFNVMNYAEQDDRLVSVDLIRAERDRLGGRPSVKYRERVFALERRCQEET